MSLTTLRFHHLPDDILLDIFLRLPVTDILSLKQTCRIFHAIGSLEYLWHCGIVPGLKIPLGIAPDVANSLSSGELQRVVISAIKLEHNWRKPTSQITRVTPVPHNIDGVSIDEMRLLPGAGWLVTAQRNRPRGRLTTSISFWSLVDLCDVHRAAIIEIPGTYRDFSVCFSNETDWGILAIGVAIGNQETIQVYKVPMHASEEHLVHAVPMLLQSIARPAAIDGVIHEVSVHGDVVATTFATLSAATGQSHQIFLINFATGTQEIVSSRSIESFNYLSIRLAHGHIILIGDLPHAFAMRIHKLPRSVFPHEIEESATPSSPVSDDDMNDLGPLIAECHLANITSQYAPEIAISNSVNILARSLCQKFSLLAFWVRDGLPGEGILAHFPVDLTTSAEEPVRLSLPQRFPVPPSTSIEIIKLGTEGHRAVWLEHNWETQEFRLMKLSAGVGNLEPDVGVILSPDPELPFSPRECHSLAFDEVTGRLCLGLYNGALYVIDFV